MNQKKHFKCFKFLDNAVCLHFFNQREWNSNFVFSGHMEASKCFLRDSTYVVIGSKTPTGEILLAVCAEMENVHNSRPITHSSSDPE